MVPYERHLFVCTNRRDPANPKGCCAAKGSEAVLVRLREAVVAGGLKGRVRVNAAGCLDQCARGVVIVVYPEAVWYAGVTEADVDEIVARHVMRGEVVERLLVPGSRPGA
jgi:(2Fe-2S) ferredoxin